MREILRNFHNLQVSAVIGEPDEFRIRISMRISEDQPAGMKLCMHDRMRDLNLRRRGDRTDHAAEIFNAELTKIGRKIKNMKKIVAIVTAAVMTMSLAACSSNTASQSAAASAAASEPAASESAEAVKEETAAPEKSAEASAEATAEASASAEATASAAAKN